MLTLHKKPLSKSKRRVLLDTNVWRYIVDAGAASEFQRVVRSSKVSMVVAPSVLFEVLRIKNNDPLRKALVELITFSGWRRLMPEAFSETQELLHEIRRCRPEWLRSQPDKTMFMALLHDWKKTSGFWERARLQTTREAGFIDYLGADELAAARREADTRREDGRNIPWPDTTPLDDMRAMFPSPRDGWDGDAFEAWRMDGWASFSYALPQADHPYAEWLSGHVDLSVIDFSGPSWLRFWIYDVKKNAMPRCWLRWAVQYLQRFRKVTDGTPCDAQLGTYLPDCDLFISADKALVRIVDQCRDYSPCRLPQAKLISGGDKGVGKLFDQLRAAS